ncbi:Fic family protein [Telmatospirillum sp. J64-1]|uniref:Fic family protein n=1 Tax=Telmatospirillum sp. J64-1 TaxID=2502183 RepID=UPI00115F092D|nr:Fic family protein [Telmatospirillum sp. J64-1]
MHRPDLVGRVQARLKRLPPPFAAHYGVVPLPPPEESVSVLPVAGRHEAAIAAIARADALARDLRDPFMISRILTRREAVSSSSIEGTHSTLDELLMVEEGNEAGTAEARQVRSYALALEEALEVVRPQAHGAFSLDLIRQLHRAVMADDPDYEDEPGRFRDRVVWIGGSGDISRSVFNPPPPEDVEACMEDQVDYLRCEGMQQYQSLITRMALAHAHFEAVHPFRDGNGRVGRLLLPLMMAADGHVPLYLSPYIEAHKGRYLEGLKLAQQRLDWAPLIGFLADAITASVEEVQESRAALSRLPELWRKRGRFRRKSAADRALDLLGEYPVLSVNRLAALLDVSYQAANGGIEALVAAGILVERTGYHRNRLFSAPEVLAVFNRPFGSPAQGEG